MSVWLSIETAPKDGTIILIFDRITGLVRAAAWDSETPRFKWTIFDGTHSADGWEPHSITAWMPLPEPPK